MPPSRGKPNPFRVGGIVRGEFFANRADERARIRRAFTSPQDHLLVLGPRRMGKSSTIQVVIDELAEQGVPVFHADLNTATTLADIGTRILQAAYQALDRPLGDVLKHFLKSIQPGVAVKTNPATHEVSVGLDLAVRDAALAEQQASLTSVLDSLEVLAKRRRRHVGVALDEFQVMHRFGGESTEAALRNCMQRHEHVSYVLAGSETRLIEAMTQRDRPLYGMLRRLQFGPIDAGFMARWIEERMRSVGLAVQPAAIDRLVRVAWPRTRDIVLLAREVVEGAPADVDAAAVAAAFARLVHEEASAFEARWSRLSPTQQNALRAVAVRSTGITTKASLRQFGLPSTSATTQAIDALEREGLVTRGPRRGEVSLDSPFFRGWIIQRALPDINLHLPLLHLPDDGADDLKPDEPPSP